MLDVEPEKLRDSRPSSSSCLRVSIGSLVSDLQATFLFHPDKEKVGRSYRETLNTKAKLFEVILQLSGQM
jgi:hypothetical protein